MVSEIVKKEVLEVKEVTFNGVNLIGVKGKDNNIYISLKKVVEDLGLEWSAQYRRAQRDEDVNDGIAIMAIGGQSVICLDVECLPIFLSKVQVSRCKEEIKPILKDFKKKVKEVLVQAFIKKEETSGLVEQKRNFTYVEDKNDNFEILEKMFFAVREQRTEVKEVKELTNRAMSTAEYALTKVLEIENKNKIAREEFKTEVEYSTRLLPDLKIRHKCQKIVDAYISNKFLAVTKEDYKSIWHQVDKEFYDRYRINLGLQKKNRQKQTNQKVTRYDIAEDLGKIEELFAVISFLFRIEKVG